MSVPNSLFNAVTLSTEAEICCFSDQKQHTFNQFPPVSNDEHAEYTNNPYNKIKEEN